MNTSLQKDILFSIIIPAYNEAAIIPECIRHIQAQNGNLSYEIIVVDNNSTDTTSTVARSLGITVIAESRQGVGAARRAGTAHAQGTYVVHIDADTQLPPTYLQEVKKRFDADDRLVCLGGQFYYYDAPMWKNILRMPTHWILWFFSRVISFGRVGPMGNNMTFKKSVYDMTAGFNEHLKFGEDMDISRALAVYGRVRLDMSLMCYISVRRFTIDKKLCMYALNFFKMCITGKPLKNELDAHG